MIPKALIPVVEYHLSSYAVTGRNGLVFPSPVDPKAYLNPDTFSWHWHRVRVDLGVPSFKLHDTRHTGGTMAARTGATLKEIMQRLGHTTPDAAMRYQHSTRKRQQAIADALSDMVVLPEVGDEETAA